MPYWARIICKIMAGGACTCCRTRHHDWFTSQPVSHTSIPAALSQLPYPGLHVVSHMPFRKPSGFVTVHVALPFRQEHRLPHSPLQHKHHVRGLVRADGKKQLQTHASRATALARLSPAIALHRTVLALPCTCTESEAVDLVQHLGYRTFFHPPVVGVASSKVGLAAVAGIAITVTPTKYALLNAPVYRSGHARVGIVGAACSPYWINIVALRSA